MPSSPQAAQGGATRRVAAKRLQSFTSSVLEKTGLAAQDADICARLMVRADLFGADGHGVFRLPQYVRRLKGGAVNACPRVRVEREAAGMALIDGDNGMGHVVMSFAAQTAIAKAKTAGAAWVGVRRSNHAGPASLYAAMPLEHDMIGLYLAVGNANHMAPWGGIDLLLSTNPVAIAVPGGAAPIVLDMATTVAAYGKVKTKAQRGESLPEGWMIDREGRPLTDPKRSGEGMLLPIGGYKGYGLSLMIGLLAGTLNRAALGSQTVDFNADDTSVTNTGHAIVALSLAAFGDVAAFKRDVDRVAGELRASRLLPGVERIWLPGEQSRAKFAERSQNGVPVPPALEQALARLAREVGVAPLD
jgi:L-2-hydroxycarboxylate dehydrogenase (NAD+)